ncbi:acyl-CoA dehydrogenase family protein [Burkholderia multivorans]|uniref:acyl-CoA dehydrogenase family protein n=1 Tax=Burkholderia multivorans TaxID=87883 RepID=UPI001C23E9BA|nr:acyl-CoA dehydrogenase family protein [Burkholderia multivorans]MBU9282573.1 acyl-CoA dehydrogenase family protein [Burkholderia multivorans]MBU9301008.1 acyl-CoA dehydrogenase family protein [Burkholderia multivorans]HEM7850528.1 acyl-CoA dehydrogenase family protein [Burkholderia multivorans]
MNDTGYIQQAEIILRQIEAVPAYAELLARHPDPDLIGSEALGMVLQSAARFAEEVLYPANRRGDAQGCRLENGQVVTADGYKEAWNQLVEQGWNAIDQPVQFGGQGLPSFVNVACRELFDRACMAMGMVSGPQRAAALVLQEFAPAETCAEWIGKFVEGRWTASIGISEPDAGSDVGRVRTRATPQPDGSWRIDGEKMWTSFGGNDMVERIGCLLLARTPDAPAGTAGLSLFLVPDKIAGKGGDWAPNGVLVRRIEEKLGLHGSPTCVMGFEGARAELIGEINRGLPQLFVMIQYMRTLVAIEGVGIGFGASQVAHAYALERRQGGNPKQPPVPIATHAEIQRLLLGMHSRVEVLRALVLELALRQDLLAFEKDESARAQSFELVQWLLPILKATCSEAAFDVSNDAIQVLGGAGYTREWPVEQWLRDSRMMSIAEGATGIQALDLLHRRLWRSERSGLKAFQAIALAELQQADAELALPALAVVRQLEQAADRLDTWRETPREAEAGATAFLQLATLAATGWMGVRLASLTGTDAHTRRLAALGRYWLSDLEPRAALQLAQIQLGAHRLALFDAL